MKRKLTSQIFNEWRSNLWLAVELMIVSVVLWYVLVTVVSTLSCLTVSPGYDVTGVYQVGFNVIADDSPRFIADSGGEEELKEDFYALYNRLKEAPGAQAVAMSFSAIPYTYNFSGMGVRLAYKEKLDSIHWTICNNKRVSPSYMEVMQIHGYNGESPAELAEQLRQDKMLITSNVFENGNGLSYDTPERMADDWAYLYNGSDSATCEIVVVVPQKRNDYEPANKPTIFWRSVDENGGCHPDWVNELTVRVDPEKTREFEEWIDSKMGNYLTINNVYANDLKPIEYQRQMVQAPQRELVYTRLACVGFLMLSIFLGLLGTFWFRTQQRVGEIAVRKVNGATDLDIFRRLMGEGLTLLVAVTPVAILCDWLLKHFDLLILTFTDSFPTWQFVLCAALAFALLALMIICGIWFPASRAMKVNPSQALADE